MARKPVVSTAILELMRRRDRHAWTLEDLQAGLAERDTTVDFSTVFRAAEKLAADGAVRKLTLDDGRSRFELIDAHHDHLHCTACDELIAVPCVIPRDAFSTLEADIGVMVSAHHVVLSGLCAACREAGA
jgi:Fe2+ or Zn2+ uptake regulation protein